MVSSVFASVLSRCFICFHTYVVIIASEYFKTTSGVASSSSSFCCVNSMSGAGSEHRQRRSPLAFTGPTCLRAGATGHTWVGMCEMRDEGQRRGRLDEELASRHPGASHALSLFLFLLSKTLVPY